MSKKTSSSQASWALLMEGIASARLTAHKLHHLYGRLIKSVDSADKELQDQMYQFFGDVLLDIPKRIESLENDLDKTSYSLVIMGEKFMKGRLSIEDRYEVRDSLKDISFSGTIKKITKRVAKRYVEK